MPVISTRSAEYVIVQAALPGRAPENIGILLIDPDDNSVHLKFRRDWEEFAGEEADYFEELAGGLEAVARDLGGREMLAYFEEKLSDVLGFSERDTAVMLNPESAVIRLYQQHITPKVLPFRTHLPMYNLQAAAGSFSESHGEIEEGDWVEVPESLKLKEGMFIARVTGHSMEPRIPAGSLCVFRHGVEGSRKERLVLVQNHGETGEDRFTIKKYTSEKARSEDGWQHARIRLVPLNPAYEAWDLDEHSKLKIVGEFIAVLSSPAEDHLDPGSGT